MAGRQQIQAGMFIDATGRSAVLLRAMGGTQNFDDRQTVIWARFALPGAGFGNSTWLEAAPNGWWYAAEVPGGAAVVALGTDPKLAKAGGVYKIHSWAAALSGTALIAPRLKQARVLPDSFRITASHSYRAARIVGENWLAVGDAACAFDPLSSAGIYKALVNGQEAARAICDGHWGPYENRIHQDYEAYLIKRAELYQAEQRWSESAFWAQRQGRAKGEAQGDRSVSPKEMSTLA
jgi:flavin-dependent dehydrogenase